jgi:toxin HigB-1
MLVCKVKLLCARFQYSFVCAQGTGCAACEHAEASSPSTTTFDVPRNWWHTFLLMIVSYRDKRTRDFAEGKRVKAFDGIHRQAELKLDQLDAATAIRDLDLPGNRLEALKGDRKGQYSIRINDQWRICFEWPDKSPGPTNVEIVDYH